MLQLTYISTAIAQVTDADLDQILCVSRFNNERANVTGLLLYDGKRFLQALEGPTAAVDATYERIRSDARHKAVVLLSSNRTDERVFGNWAMAAPEVRPAGSSNIAETVDMLTESVTDATIRATFRSFARIRSQN